MTTEEIESILTSEAAYFGKQLTFSITINPERYYILCGELKTMNKYKIKGSYKETEVPSWIQVNTSSGTVFVFPGTSKETMFTYSWDQTLNLYPYLGDRKLPTHLKGAVESFQNLPKCDKCDKTLPRYRRYIRSHFGK